MTNLALDRMPPQIGNFIAQTVYSSDDPESEPLLKSNEHHSLADSESLLCHFVNVPGQQITHDGKSLKASALSMSLLQTTSPFLESGGV